MESTSRSCNAVWTLHSASKLGIYVAAYPAIYCIRLHITKVGRAVSSSLGYELCYQLYTMANEDGAIPLILHDTAACWKYNMFCAGVRWLSYVNDLIADRRFSLFYDLYSSNAVY